MELPELPENSRVVFNPPYADSVRRDQEARIIQLLRQPPKGFRGYIIEFKDGHQLAVHPEEVRVAE